MEPYAIDPDTQWENSVKLLGDFDAYRTAYKFVNSQPIYAFFIIPKQLRTGLSPLLVRFHGGGFSEGEAEASLRPFFLQLALKHQAVIITPDYRLRPEHELTDSVDDIRSFWKWIEQGNAQKLLKERFPGLDLDVNNLLVGGESAGGYMTAQTGLLGLTDLPIKVLFIQYPCVALARHLETKEDKKGQLFGPFKTPYPYSIVQEHLASLKPGQICTRAKFGSRMPLVCAMVQAGKFCDLTGDNSYLDPMSSLETAGKLPPILLYASTEDEAVNWEDARDWADRLRELQPDVPLHVSWQTGSHVFDCNDTMESLWLEKPLEFVQKYWPAR